MTICAVPGIRVGHATHQTEATGCTVILPDQPAVAGVSVCGGAPGTRETELLRPGFLVRHIHGIMLSGGSAFGLRTADGVMRFLVEKQIGFPARNHVVPLVPAAVIFDLTDGRDINLPSEEMGYQACLAADYSFAEGRIGAGRGATIGKLWGEAGQLPGGVGSAAITINDGVVVGAIAVVNAFGDIVDPNTGEILAGLMDPNHKKPADTMAQLRQKPLPSWFEGGGNTTLVTVATNAQFTVEEINRVALMAQNGIARTIRPAHSMLDGDIVFALSNGDKTADLSTVGEFAAQVVAEAILRAVSPARRNSQGSFLKDH